MLLDLSESAVRAALKRYESLFSNGDVEAILEGFSDDVKVRYASFAPFTGKEQLRAMLRQRFARMRDYRLSKVVEFVSLPRIASSWTGKWIEAEGGVEMELFGLEVMTVRNGKIVEWSASVSTWRAGQQAHV